MTNAISRARLWANLRLVVVDLETRRTPRRRLTQI
jgi:hypothetical protein